MAQSPYVLFKSDGPDSFQWSSKEKQAEEALEEGLSKAPTLEHLSYNFSFFIDSKFKGILQEY